jgi:hypothetical protein
MSIESAKAWREMHFDDQHPENPMKKANCRIQRRMVDVEKSFDNPAMQARMLECLNHG